MDPQHKKRAQSFAQWLSQRSVEVSPSDGERIATELFELTGHGVVDQSHVDALAGQYRKRLMGPRVIITATQVGELVLAWQASAAAPPAARAAAPAETPPPPREASLDELLAEAEIDLGALPDLGLPFAAPTEPSTPSHHRSMSDSELNAYADPVGGRDPFALSNPPAAELDLSLDFDADTTPSERPYRREEVELGGADETPDLELSFDEVLVGEELDVRDFGALDFDPPKKR